MGNCDIAEADTFDQPFVAGSDHRGELGVELAVGEGGVHPSQVDRGESIDAECLEVVFDAAT